MKTVRICTLTLLTAIFLNVFCLAQQPVSAPQQTQPYTPQDINMALRRNVGRDMTENDLAARIQRLGVAFDPTPEIVSRFRFNGAHPHLMNTIKRAGEKYAPASDVLVSTKVNIADPIIEEVRQKVKDYVDGMPDFICTQEVQRSMDFDGSGSWQRIDELRYELTYNRKHETYKPLPVNGLLSPRNINNSGGASSAGEFASTLDNLFDPATEAVFKPAGKEKLGTHQTLIYDYRVTQQKSKLVVRINDDPQFIPGYAGTVWIDAKTKDVLRIEQAVEDPPVQYRTFSGDKTIDYEMVKLRGVEGEVLLPIRAEVMMLNRGQKSYSRNLISFKFYRKFESDIKFIEGAESDKPEKPEPPEKPPGEVK